MFFVHTVLAVADKQIFFRYFHLSTCFSCEFVPAEHTLGGSATWNTSLLAEEALAILCCSTGNYPGDAGRGFSSSLLNSLFHHLHISHSLFPFYYQRIEKEFLRSCWLISMQGLHCLLHFISFADWVYSRTISAILDYINSKHLWTFEVLHLWKTSFHDYFIKLYLSV